MSRADLEFQVAYSVNLEEMQHVLCSRADRICTLIQLALGAASFGQAFNSAASVAVTGATVAAIAALQYAFQFGAKASDAKHQRNRYIMLRKEMRQLSDDELQDRIEDLQAEDSSIAGSLQHPAWLVTSYAGSYAVAPGREKITLLQWLFAFMAGSVPREP